MHACVFVGKSKRDKQAWRGRKRNFASQNVKAVTSCFDFIPLCVLGSPVCLVNSHGRWH